jgi:hypothetical protein
MFPCSLYLVRADYFLLSGIHLLVDLFECIFVKHCEVPVAKVVEIICCPPPSL